MDEIEGISAERYVRYGGMLVLRDALGPDNADSWYRLWYDKYGSLDLFPWEQVRGEVPSAKIQMEILQILKVQKKQIEEGACPTCNGTGRLSHG